VVRLVSLIVGAFLLGSGGFVRASESTEAVQSATPTLTLRRAVELVLERNATLRAFGAAREAERARGDAFSLAPRYRIVAELENFAGTGEAGGVDSLESTLSLSGVVELGGKRRVRRDVASVQLDVLDTELQVRRLDLAATVARRYVDLVRAEALVELRRDSAAIAARTLETVRARVAAARASRADIAKAEIALAWARLDEQAAERLERTNRVALASLWGGESPDFGTIRAELFRLPTYEPFASLVTRTDQNPDLALLASRVRLDEARARLADAQRRTDVVWTAGIRRLEAQDDQAFVVGIELPLGSAARAEPLRRESSAERNRRQLEAEARRMEVRATLYSAYEQLEQARTELATLREQSTPLAEDALRITEQGYERGRYSLLELSDAQTQLLAVRGQTIEAAADFHRTLIEIQQLTNQAVVETASGE